MNIKQLLSIVLGVIGTVFTYMNTVKKVNTGLFRIKYVLRCLEFASNCSRETILKDTWGKYGDMRMDVEAGESVNEGPTYSACWGACGNVMIKGAEVKHNGQLHILHRICGYQTTDFHLQAFLGRNSSDSPIRTVSAEHLGSHVNLIFPWKDRIATARGRREPET